MEEKLQKMAKEEILELKEVLRELSITPDSSTYIQLYEAAKSLYFEQSYRLAADISRSVRLELLTKGIKKEENDESRTESVRVS